MMYEVTVGNVGLTYRGDDEAKAKETFNHYKSRSENGSGREAGEEVILWEDGHPIEEFEGSINQQEDEDESTD